ncbi:phosphatase 2C5 [Actinidia rufa]|uniref:Phosphatase 2C5 n=1 Tax=Actinidia rufa TaxID=165716 RepID=A0A7J0E4N2_9ERIC|nr:phosphatase 2C5 [Actinidia rufa]
MAISLTYPSPPLEKNCGEAKGIVVASKMVRKRPARLIVPDCLPVLDFRKEGGRSWKMGMGSCLTFLETLNRHFSLLSMDTVAERLLILLLEHLGKNIVKALEFVGGEEDKLKAAIHEGYLSTDKDFLSQGQISGACAASVLFRDGHLHVANVGDCRVVLSRKGVADVLTSDHRLSREDERYVHCRNGVWRVNGSLAISRAIGDPHMKEWIICEPEIRKLPLTSDCEFLIMASDGLWDKVNDQEAVDLVLSEKNSLVSCKKLVDMSCKRGNIDDITVIVINVQRFAATSI